jgi:hypothetical protein
LFLALAKLNNGHDGLRLPITWSKDEDGVYVQDKDDVEAAGCLQYVQNELLTFLDTLHKNGLIELHKIVWDWRRCFEEAEKKIAAKIENICSNSRQATILTHSTGALVAWPTISKHPEFFSSWINAAGCLLKASNTFLSEFDRGYSMGPLKMLSKESFFTFPGLYSYFPILGEEFGGTGKSDYIDSDGIFYTPKEFDIYTVSTWEKFRLGVFGWKSQVTEQEREHLKHSLETAKRFRQKNLMKGDNPYDSTFLDKDLNAYNHLKIICYGTNKLQCHSAYEINMREKTIDTSTSRLKASGDGTLFTSNWQTVPGGLKRQIIMAEEGSDHVSLVNDLKLQGVLLDAFFAADDLKKASAKSLLN